MLVLPWAGCQFVRETESALRSGQQELLSGTALAIADSLSQFPDEFLSAGTDRFDENQIYGHPLANAPLIDGYFDDWSIDDDSLRSLRGADGNIQFVFGAYRQHVFLYIDVRDTSITYATPGSTAKDVDHVDLLTSDDRGGRIRFRFAAEAPGTISTMRVEEGDELVDSQFAAH